MSSMLFKNLRDLVFGNTFLRSW